MKVLIAEDDVVCRHLLECSLQKWNFQVASARDGAEAWSLWDRGGFPLVISDWMMPELDGVELIRRIRARQRPEGYVYTILLTARSQKEDVVAGMEAGADDFLTKPFDHEELRVRVRAGERIVRLEQALCEQNRSLREAQAALVQSEKLASLGQLAAGVAHEINNPVAYVTNNLAVLRRDVLAALNVLDRYREGRDHLAQVAPDLAAAALQMEQAMDLPYLQANLGRLFDKSLDGLRRVRDIVKNLRDFARLDEAEFKDIDIPAALTSTVEMLHYETEQRGIRIETHFPEVPFVQGHPGKLNQVFLNMLLNAVQACDRGGVVEVSVRCEAREALLIEIRDNGCGIPAEHLPHIFEPFFTTKPLGQGTGLGLSISYGIIRDHGGSITAESTPGKGSLFRVRLPLQSPQGSRDSLR